MYTPINDGDSGLLVRTELNAMLSELYASILLPVKRPNVTGNTTIAIPANSNILDMAIVAASGTPTIRIGTTPNGEEIMEDTVITSIPTPIVVNQYFGGAGTLYITFSSGVGAINIRMDIIYNYF